LTGDTERANLFERMFKLLPADDSDSYELLRLSRAAENGEHKSEGESEDESAEDVSLLQADSSMEEDTDGGSEMIQPSDRDVAFGRGLIMGKEEEPCKIVYITNSGKEKFLDSIMIIADQDCQTTVNTSKARGAGFSISTQRRILAKLPGSSFFRCVKGGVWQEATRKDVFDRCKAEYRRAARVRAPLMELTNEGYGMSVKQQIESPCHGGRPAAFVERSDRDVCFGDPGHPGTVAWRAAVNKAVSKNRHALRWTKSLFDSIVKELTSSGPRQLLVRSKSDSNRWQVATDKAASKKTSGRYFKYLSDMKAGKAASSKSAGIRTTQIGESSRVAGGSSSVEYARRAKRAASMESPRGGLVKKRPAAKRAKVKRASGIEKKKPCGPSTEECETVGPPAEGTDIRKTVLGMIEYCKKAIEASDLAPKDGALLLRAAVAKKMKDEVLQGLLNVPWAHAMNDRANDSQVDKVKRHGADAIADRLTRLEVHWVSFLNRLEKALV
jgi:hypothetical protein